MATKYLKMFTPLWNFLTGKREPTAKSKNPPEVYRCPDPECHGKVVPALYFDGEQDGPGHEYAWVCRGKCGRTYGESWVTRLWGESEAPTLLAFEPWKDDMPLPITRQLLRPHATGWAAELLKKGIAGLLAYLIIIALLNVAHVKAAQVFSSILI